MKILLTGPRKCGKNVSMRKAGLYSVDLDSMFWNANENKVSYDFGIVEKLFKSEDKYFTGNCDEEQRLIRLAKRCKLLVIGLACMDEEEFKNCTMYIDSVDECVTFLKQLIH